MNNQEELEKKILDILHKEHTPVVATILIIEMMNEYLECNYHSSTIL